MVDVVAGTVATNYDTATSHTITVRETLVGALNSPRDTVLTINVTDAGAVPGPFTLAWTSAASELTNLSFSITPAPLVGDVVTLSLDGNSDMSSPFDTSDANTIDAGEAASGSLTFTGIATPLSAGLTYARVAVVRGAASANSSIASITLTAGDTTAPVLSSPTGTKTGSTTATLTVSTDEANGTLYGSASAAAPTKAQIKLGQTSTGAASTYAFNQAVTATGVQTKNATGLTAATPYTMHYMHEDTAGNQSNVASASSFTTDAAGATWDPAQKGGDITLSGGNLTATTTAVSGNHNVRTTTTLKTGKRVVKLTTTDCNFSVIGLCNSSYTPTDATYVATSANATAWETPSGTIKGNGVMSAGALSFAWADSSFPPIWLAFEDTGSVIKFTVSEDGSTWWEVAAPNYFAGAKSLFFAGYAVGENLTLDTNPSFSGLSGALAWDAP